MTATLVATPDPEPCEHAWRYIERFDLLHCPLCQATMSPDDDPGDDDGPVAA